MPQQASDPLKGTQSSASDIIAQDGLIGRVVGSYRLEERLGGGAMASVYRVIDIHSGEQIALKLLLPGADQAMRERFRREVKTVSQLNFPNIVRTLQVSTQAYDELAYIAMELVEGESLGQLLDRSGQLSMIDSCALLAPIARALAYAHERGVVHRDVKPSNILLRRTIWGDPNAVRIAAIDTPVVPLLSDFGIALVLDAPELTSAGRTIGTPAYMAPEQCSGSRAIDGRADIYALGAVLFRCLIGRPLFLGSTTQILHAHVYEPVAIPDENMRLLSPVVVEILQSALAKEVEDRYADAGWLADDLAVAAGQRVRTSSRKSTSSEATATMVSLPVTTSSTKTATFVLVPAPERKSDSLAADRASINNATLNSASIDNLPENDPIIPLIRPRRTQQVIGRSTRNPGKARLSSLGRTMAISLTLVMAFTAIVFAVVMWPRTNPPTLPVATSTVLPPTAVEVAIEATPAATPVPTLTDVPAPPTPTASATLVADTLTPTAIATLDASDETGVTGLAQVEISATMTTSLTLEPGSSPVVSLSLGPDEALAMAINSFEEGQWSTVFEVLAQLQKSAPTYSPDSVAKLLGENYLILAALNNQEQAYAETIKLLESGEVLLTNSPVVDQLQILSRATKAVLLAENEAPRSRALETLQKVHLSFVTYFEASARPCAALEHLDAAQVASENPDYAPAKEELEQACTEHRRIRQEQIFLTSLQGEILYSAQVGSALEKSNIYRQPVTTTAPSTLLIANARYPVRQRAGSLIAYFNMIADASGIYGFDPSKNLDPGDRGRALAKQYVEDGRDSPASWSFSGDQLVFASTREGDRRSRLFMFANDGSNSATMFVRTYATWPAWRPVRAGSGEDWIVYNGTNSAGNDPGLWLVGGDGVAFARVSDNGDDIAPMWAADGSTLFFVNQSRSGNWDIYATDVEDATLDVSRPVFNSPASDVMPAISPDGRALAFVSNRGGTWQIWIAPLDPAHTSSDAILLADLEGNIPDPTQQSMQWVK